MANDLITLEIQDGIAILTNNRPEKHNAANDEMDRQLFGALEEIHGRSDLRVVLWRGKTGIQRSTVRDVLFRDGAVGETVLCSCHRRRTTARRNESQ